jgi:cyclopropane-fatty-acyl-phospholipid synthase
MEIIERISTLNTASWLDKRCRSLVHSVFDKISYRQLDVIEGSEHHFLLKYQLIKPIKGKLIVHDISL